MKFLRNEQGVALLTALMLTLISLAIILAVLYLVTQGMQVSAASKRYKNALEASYGGTEVFAKELIPRIFSGYSTSRLTTDFAGIDLSFSDQACLKRKMENSTADWGGLCAADTKTMDPKAKPDATFLLQGLAMQPGFRVYTKIVDTVKGNSDASMIDYLDSAAGVAYGASGVSPQHLPTMFSIEVQGERATKPQEKARLTLLYAY